MRLYQFAISHFCEKARWAMQYKGIEFEPVNLVPGPHMFVVKKIARRTSVPVLEDQGSFIQGSNDILEHLESKHPEKPLLPKDPALAEEVKQWVTLSDQIGEDFRAIVYSEALTGNPKEVKRLWKQGAPLMQRFMINFMYPLVVKKVKQNYKLYPDKVAAYEARFEETLAKFDAAYERGPYLVGDSFTWADLSIAAMLANMASPPKHSVKPRGFTEKTDAFLARYRESKTIKRIFELYETYR